MQEKKTKGVQLDDGTLENASGGLVHKTQEKVWDVPSRIPGWHTSRMADRFEVIDDETGERIGGLFNTQEEAEKAAYDKSQSTELISDNALNYLRAQNELKNLKSKKIT